jgi:amino acid permease
MRGGAGGTEGTNNVLGTIVGSALGVNVERPLFFFSILIMLVTSFINFLVVSRYLYGLAEKHEAFRGLKDLNSEKVPWKAVLLTCGLIFGGLFVNNTLKLVELSDFFLTCALAAVSGAVTVMRWKKGETPWVEGGTTLGFLAMMYSCCWPF